MQLLKIMRKGQTVFSQRSCKIPEKIPALAHKIQNIPMRNLAEMSFKGILKSYNDKYFLDSNNDKYFLDSNSIIMKEIDQGANNLLTRGLKNPHYKISFLEKDFSVYQNFKPRFVKELDQYSQDFIGYLEHLGAFEYKKGGDDGFAINTWLDNLENHGAFYFGVVSSKFAEPDFYKKIENPLYIPRCKSFGQMATTWQVAQDAGLIKS